MAKIITTEMLVDRLEPKKERPAYDAASPEEKYDMLQHMYTDDERRAMTAAHQSLVHARGIMREAKADYDCAVASGDTAAVTATKAILADAVSKFRTIIA